MGFLLKCKMAQETNKISQFWDEQPAWLKLVVIAIIIFLVIAAAKWVYGKYKAQKSQKLLEGNVVTTSSTSNGQTIVQTIDLGTKVSAIDNAIYHYWGGMAENETVMMREILDVPQNLIPKLSDLYYQFNGHNLKQDYQKYLDDDEYNQIAHKFQGIA